MLRRNDVGALRSAVAREETPGTVAAVRDEFGGTPLHCAAMKGHRNTLVYLLSHGTPTKMNKTHHILWSYNFIDIFRL